MKCNICGNEMKDLFTSQYCPNDCDEKKEVVLSDITGDYTFESWFIPMNYVPSSKKDNWFHFGFSYNKDIDSNLLAYWRFDNEVD